MYSSGNSFSNSNSYAENADHEPWMFRAVSSHL
jgi:hypothetical protein